MRKAPRRGALGRLFSAGRRVLLGAALLPAAAGAADRPWPSSVIAEAQGRIAQHGERRVQVRFGGWSQEDFSAFSTHAYDNRIEPVAVTRRTPPAAIAGDAARGREIWDKAACINCHALAADTRWSGNVGPSFAAYGERQRDRERTYQIIYDARVVFPHTLMPPWGSAGLLDDEDIAHLTAFLHSLTRANSGAWSEAGRDPDAREPPQRYFGDNLDDTRNPAVIFTDDALERWGTTGTGGKSCASCHGAAPEDSMRGVALRYPQYAPTYARMVSLEDFLSEHGPATTGHALPVESDANLNMSVLIRMASNGMPIALDMERAEHRAAWERGREIFYRRIGQRNHACADCHSRERAEGRWLGGRYIGRALVDSGLTASYPAWRTSFGQVWGLRRRIQWCMLPHGANNLAADAPEYADLEFYMTSFENGRPLNVPGLKD